MSSTNDHMPDDKLIADYLLGSLAEADTERLDELSITDNEFAHRLRCVEDDLVDAYVRGELSGEILNRFRSHYLASPLRREKVTFAESLVSFADRESGAGAVSGRTTEAVRMIERGARRPEPRRFWGVTRPALAWGFAAVAILLVIAVAYLAVDHLRLQKKVAEVESQRAILIQRAQELERTLGEQRSADAETARELARVRESLAQLEQELANVRKGPGEKPEVGTVSFSLAPQLRGISQIANVGVPARAKYVQLDLRLESDDFPTYESALKSLSTGQIVSRAGGLRSRTTVVSIKLDRNLLKPGNYIVELTGVRKDRSREIIAAYAFKAVLE